MCIALKVIILQSVDQKNGSEIVSFQSGGALIVRDTYYQTKVTIMFGGLIKHGKEKDELLFKL